jgi:hypothetical protein
MNKLIGFLEFESNQLKSERGGMILYDVKGHYKYLTFSELLDYYIKNIIKDGIKTQPC